MKRNLSVVCLAAAMCAAPLETALAHLPIHIDTRRDDGLIDLACAPVQVGLYAGYPFQLFSGAADVYGVAAGLLNLRQGSAVVSVALENRVNYFLQAGLASVCDVNYAFETGFLCITRRNFGISAGIFNYESVFGARGDYPWPGLQVGLANGGGGLQAGFFNGSFDACFQAGVINVNGGSGGVQIGLINISNDCEAPGAWLQVGLFNYNPHAVVTWLPILNFSCDRKNRRALGEELEN